MSRTYQGGLITKTPVTPAGPAQCGAASGIWTIDQMVGWQKAGVWPTAGLADGTFAIFALGLVSSSPSSIRNKYTYSGDVNASTTSSSLNSYGPSAAGNSTVGIFAIGATTLSACNRTTVRNKFTYSSSANASAAASSQAGYWGGAAGNSTIGIFQLGSASGGVSTYTDKYTYSSCTSASTTASSNSGYYSYAAGTSTFGIFNNGAGTGCLTKYTYATDAYVYGVGQLNCGFSTRWGAATGNATVGIFALGTTGFGAFTNVATRKKFTYSSCAVSSATSSTIASRLQSAAGNSSIGIFALGYNAGAVRNKYTYSGDVNASATSATASSYQGAGASNGTAGVNT